MAARIDKIVISELAATDPITHNEIVRIWGLTCMPNTKSRTNRIVPGWQERVKIPQTPTE